MVLRSGWTIDALYVDVYVNVNVNAKKVSLNKGQRINRK